jgi:predicted O-linked N-acetylglucosamine transferase (SPINDLY family)
MGRMDEALSVYREHLARDPDGLFVMHSSYLFTLSYQERTWPEALLEEALAFGQKVTRKAAHCAKHGNAPDPTRQLRLGLVSGDLGQHPVGFFLANVLESINPEQLEVHAYATAVRHDEVNARLRRSIAHWRDASPDKLDDEALARQIQADGIDILIDLSGHTAHNRLPVFAWKPAPIQVTWLGYLGTTGVGAMDYVLADPYALPVGEENQFVETPWRLPEGYICFSPPELPVEVGQLPASKNGYVTFGCFNNIKKVNQQVVACWAEILKAVPGSRLYLKTRGLDAPEVRAEMTTAFAAHGIAAERLILEGQFASHEEHFRAYQRVDIALDPFPYPGITTSVEALWMGVPVLSLQGDRFISHQGETILHNVGLPDWVARDEADYVAKAAAFAGDLQGLSELRAGLRPRLLASPLCDAPRFARNFEAALRGMWQKWCAEQGARQ